MNKYPDLDDIRANAGILADYVLKTPVQGWRGPETAGLEEDGIRITLKLELFQYTGTFKPRGAITNMLAMDKNALSRGVTAVSAGNHAIATAFAAKALGSSAKVVMISSASKKRVERCRYYGAEVILKDDIHEAFEEVERIRDEEGRTFVHPFEGERTVLGTASCGLEFGEQVPDLDAVIIPIGGGGLCAGMAAALKQLHPDIKIYGVEPEGADTMRRSFAAGEPQKIDKVRTIADSLGAPHAAPYSFGVCRRFVDDIVLVSDEDMRASMKRLFDGMKLAVEPAGASATAALFGPLRQRLAGKHVGLVICGANIAAADYCRLLPRDSETAD